MLTIGCHLSTTKGYRAMGETALSIGANTFAFFTRNPRGGKAKDLDMDDVAALRELMEQNDFGPLVAHAPYTYNPCSAKERAREFALEAMAEDLRRMEALPGNYYNFHPGAHVGQGTDAGIQMIVDTLCQVMFEGQQTTVLLETMAGKGTEVGRSFEELARIIEGAAARRPELSAKLGVCLDTCHVNDAGYDIVHDLDGVLDEFDRVVGIERLRAVHINERQTPRTPAAPIRTATSASVRVIWVVKSLAAVCRLCRILYRIAACAYCHSFWRHRTNLQVMQLKSNC